MRVLIFVLAVWLLVCGATAPALASRIAPLQEFPDQATVRADGKAVAVSDLARATRAAAERSDWTIREEAPDHLVASIEIHGKHSAEVDIFLRPGAFDLKYRSSHNLNYHPAEATSSTLSSTAAPPSNPPGAVIHPNYNRKVRDFVAAIKREALR